MKGTRVQVQHSSTCTYLVATKMMIQSEPLLRRVGLDRYGVMTSWFDTIALTGVRMYEWCTPMRRSALRRRCTSIRVLCRY